MLGGIFPLITAPMFRRMTFEGASSFLGGVVSCFAPLLCSNANVLIFQ